MAFEHLHAVFRACRCQIGQTDRLVLYAVVGHASPEGKAWPSKSTLLRQSSMSDEKALEQSIRRLVARGLLVIVKAGHGRSSTRYLIRLDGISKHCDGSELTEPCPRDLAKEEAREQARQAVGQSSEGGANPLTPGGFAPPSPSGPNPPTPGGPNTPREGGPAPPSEGGAAPPRSSHGISKYNHPPPTPPAQPNRPDQSTQDPGEEGEEEDFESPEKGRRKARQNSPEVLTQAWQQLRDAAGNKLQSSLSRSDWQSWCQAFDESGATPAQARTVGEWIAKDGMSWVKLPKLRYLVSHWERCLTQALEWHAGRGPTRAAGIDAAESARDVVRQARGKAVPPPPEALEQLQGLGLGGLFKRSDGDTP